MAAEPEPICTFLDWDSEFFSRRIARANRNRLDHAAWNELQAWCVTNRIECLYFLADFDDPLTTRLAEANGFLFVDVRMTFDHALRDIPPVASSVLVRPACEQDLSALRDIARTAHRDTRFYFDQHFDRAKCDLLYEVWVENSFRGFAQAVLVAEVDRTPAGYVTGHLQGQDAQLGILGVGAAHQGRGVGSILVQHFLAWARQQRAQRGFVVTQGRNVRAQRLYQRSGFVSASSHVWFHRWFTD